MPSTPVVSNLRAEDFGVAARSASACSRAPIASTVVVEAEAGLVAEIERRMRVEDLQSGEQQEEQADRPDPMGDPRPARTAGRPEAPVLLVAAARSAAASALRP